MTQRPSPNRGLVRIPTASHTGRGVLVAAGLLATIVALGVLGRLVPDPRDTAAESPTLAPAVPSAFIAPGVRVVSPVADVIWMRTTEIAVRGVVPLEVGSVDAAIRVDGQVLGQVIVEVDRGGRFDGIIQIIPPIPRTPAVLELRGTGPDARRLAEVAISIEADALLLIRHPTDLTGEAGGLTVVDVLVYPSLPEVRCLLTSPGGMLIASTSRRLRWPGTGAGAAPRTVGLELELPMGPLPDRGRLHVLGIDEHGSEVEHIDANVRLSSGG